MTSAFMAPAARPYLRWALILLGAALLIAVSQIKLVESEDAARSEGEQKLTLGGIQTIEQTFTTTRPGLVGLAIPIGPGSAGDTDLTIPLHLRYADGPPIDLVSTSLALQSAENGVITLRFPELLASRDPYVLTGTLRLVLDIPAIPPGTGPAIVAHKDGIAQGALLIDGLAQAELDLAITPLYERRWADSIWPISAMAAGKPGIFGWPPLYVLLPYLYVVAIAAGAAALRQTYTLGDG